MAKYGKWCHSPLSMTPEGGEATGLGKHHLRGRKDFFFQQRSFISRTNHNNGPTLQQCWQVQNSTAGSSRVIYATPPPLSSSQHYLLWRMTSPGHVLAGRAWHFTCMRLQSPWGHEGPHDKGLKVEVGFLGAFHHLVAFRTGFYHLSPSNTTVTSREVQKTEWKDRILKPKDKEQKQRPCF